MEFKKRALIKRDRATVQLEPGHLATLHCFQCNTVLGDTLSVCGELPCLESIMCLKVTDDVLVTSDIELGHKGQLTNCIFSYLTCGKCGQALGKVLQAAPPHLGAVRSLFLLHKAHVMCYMVDSCSMVKASTVSFEFESLIENINEVKQKFEVYFDAMRSRLAEGINVSNK
nr:protein Mis18-beta-like [Nerophis lumbriciformis]